MKFALRFLLVASSFFCFSCVDERAENTLIQTGEVDTLQYTSQIKYAKRFSIYQKGNNTCIAILSDHKSNDTTFTYILYRNVKDKPILGQRQVAIEVPVQRMVCLSSLFIGCCEKLNLLDNIIGIDNVNYVCNKTISEKVIKGSIKELSKDANINVEATLALHPDLVFSFGMGDPEKDFNKNLLNAGIPLVVTIDHLEHSPLARAEWIKFVAAFTGKEKMADSLFLEVESRYTAAKALADSVITRPTVFTEMKYSDTWFIPGGKSFLSVYLQDAGAEYIWKENSDVGSLELSYEEVYAKAGKADYWINLFSCHNKMEVLKQDKRYADFSAYKTGKLYNNNKLANEQDGNAYWETGLWNPDIILLDLIKIFHPELVPKHEFIYYQKLN